MKKALVIRFIEKEMSTCMRLAAFDYRRGNYSDAHGKGKSSAWLCCPQKG